MKRTIRLSSSMLITLLLFAATTTALWAGVRPDSTAHQAVETADFLFARGDYAVAAQTYRQLVGQGYADAGLYFNLGQAYREAGDLGHAVWAFRAAKELAPRDGTIDSALHQVREQLGRHEEGLQPGLGAVTVAAEQGLPDLAQNWFTLNELAVITLTLWVLVCILLLARLLLSQNSRGQRMVRAASVVVTMILLLAGLALGGRLVRTRHLPAAVVVDAQVTLHHGPGTDFIGEQRLVGGAEVRILETRGAWVNISLEGTGSSGWVPSHSVAQVMPHRES